MPTKKVRNSAALLFATMLVSAILTAPITAAHEPCQISSVPAAVTVGVMGHTIYVWAYAFAPPLGPIATGEEKAIVIIQESNGWPGGQVRLDHSGYDNTCGYIEPDTVIG